MKSFFYGLFCLFLMLGSVATFAQIGIGTKTPAASAALEVTSSTNNKGILIPRITATQKDAIVSPAEGLLVYQITAPIGFYYYSGTAWKLMANATDLSTTGNAGTATKLAASKNINGVAFDGSADITVTADAGTLTGTTLKSTVIGSSLTSVGTLTNLAVTNPIVGSVTGSSGSTTGNAGTVTTNASLTGPVTSIGNATAIANGAITNAMLANGAVVNLSGTNTGDQTTITGTAGTATKLAASKNINGVAFDGSADIIVPAAAGTLTGTTLNSTVTGSSLTSVGTLANLTVTNPIAGTITGTASNVTGIVVIANGGTNSTATATAGGIGYGTGTAHAYTAAGTNGQVLSSNGAGVPTWTTPSTTATAYSGTLPGANGGTGVANTGKTITLGGNLTTSGAFATTLTTTAATSITLPTSGTIATMAANVNVQTGTTYTLLDSDNGKVITLNNGSAITLTVPIGLSAGFNCLVVQLGAGVITFTASSTTIYNRGTKTKTAGQYAIATIVSYTDNTFITSGDMTQ